MDSITPPLRAGFYPSGISNPTQALAIDSAGDVYVTGVTNATNFPLQNRVL